MSDFCYTVYKFEGEETAMERFAGRLFAAQQQKKPWRFYIEAAEGKQHRRLRLMERIVGPEGGILTDLNENCLSEAGVGRQVLSLVTETPWKPRNDLWDKILRAYAPDIKYYYRAEEFAAGLCETNDIDKRYWGGDYAVCAYLYKEACETKFDVFFRPEQQRFFGDQYKYYISYWDEKDVKHIIDKGLKGPDIYPGNGGNLFRKPVIAWLHNDDFRIEVYGLNRSLQG